MITCTVILKTGEKIIFEESTMEAAIARYTNTYRAHAKTVYFDEEVQAHNVPTDHDCHL